jgi:hepatocyte growth factor-regulated tyrosine kinase substrate
MISRNVRVSRPKNAIQQLKKKMFSPNPHTALYALMVLESIVKNCGAPVHEEISNKSNCEMYAQLVQTTTHENVRNKMLELIQTWSYAFRSAHKYRGIRVNNTHTNIFRRRDL